MTATMSSSPSKTSTSPQRTVKKKAKVSANAKLTLTTHHDNHATPSPGTPAAGPVDSGQLLLDRRLFSARTSKRLDLSIASTHHQSNQSHASELTAFQVFPRQIFVHEHLCGHHLRELWLTNHHISILPAEIAHFPKLRVLGLGGNALTTLPTEIRELPSLECLYLERNQLRNLPDNAVFPSKLTELRLDHNALSVFPVQLTRLRLLNRLGLSHNQISSLPQEIKRMINLVELDLDFNRLQLDGFPGDAVVRLQRLERLGLDGNLLSERPQCLKQMPNVAYVRLNGNRRQPTEQASGSGEGHSQVVSVPRRQDGYFQTVKGYQSEKTHSVKSQEAKRGGDTFRPQPEPLEGLVVCRDQNTVNAHSYRFAVPHLRTARSNLAAVVKPPAIPAATIARDRRASSAIALLEGLSWVAPYPDDLLNASDVEEETETVDTSINHSDGYSAMMHTPSVNAAGAQHHDVDHAVASNSSSSSNMSSGSNAKDQSFVARYRVIEFAVSIVMIGMAGVLALVSVHMRDIPNVEVRISSTNIVYARDPTLNNKMMDQQVSMVALVVGATAAPILANLFINYLLPKFKRVRVIPHDTRDFLLSLAQSVGISQVLTQFMKNMTGRFRPCFYEMCKWNYDVVWDGKTNLCQDEKWEKEGRRSFPSGHSSYAWCTLFLMTLYLMGRSRLNCENRDQTLLRGGRKTLKLFLCFLPTLVAAWVAVTRSVDNWHHYTDIVTGSIIGAFGAGFGYNYNYGSIFNWESAGVPYQEYHLRRKKKDGIDMQEVSRSLLHTTMELDTDARSLQSHSASNASYTTAHAPKTAGSDSFSINIK